MPRILDVGCGSGRDLCRLLALGHDAIGTDASRAMLDAAAESCRRKGINPDNRLIEDGLPDLELFEDCAFDGVLCSAVLMHLPEERLFDSVYGMRRVLRPGGRLLLSIPAQRPDIDPVTRRDPDGRYFADLPPAKLKLLLERVGFRLLWERVTDDALQRPGHTWATFLFKRLGEDAERPLDQVESILNRDKKDATYKLALFRALADIAQTQYNIAHYDPPGRVGIPIHALAERWLVYYWPIVASETFIPQKYGELPGSAKPVAIRIPLKNLIDSFGECGGLPAFMVALKNDGLPQPAQQAYRNAISKIGSTIWNMPVRYAGGGEDFSVFGYDRATRRVTMPESLWRELTLTGSWILDATVLRWAELTERLSKGAVSVSLAIEKLLSITDPDRETRDARQLFARIGVTECVWSERSIRSSRFDVDHVIPFVLWHNNDLWNLLPAHPAINNQKRDLLPTQGLLRRRRDRVIGYWEALPVIGALAAGDPYSGFDIGNLDAATDCSWMAVPRRMAGRNRFVIRINGDSMEPELNVGDWVVFEYHRTPRTTNQIVIANLADLGITSDLTTEHAVKRLHQDAEQWIFKSTNPCYDDFRVSKQFCAYPILGIMVGRLTKYDNGLKEQS